jgi:hypothetical protein
MTGHFSKNKLCPFQQTGSIALAIVLLCAQELRAADQTILLCSRPMGRYPKSWHLEINKKRGFVDKTGKMVFDARDGDIIDWRLHEGLLRVFNLEGKYGFWNKKGELAFPQRFVRTIIITWLQLTTNLLKAFCQCSLEKASQSTCEPMGKWRLRSTLSTLITLATALQ